MFPCYYCPRVVCKDRCMTLNASPTFLNNENTFFICPVCHAKNDRLLENKVPTPYSVSLVFKYVFCADISVRALSQMIKSGLKLLQNLVCCLSVEPGGLSIRIPFSF